MAIEEILGGATQKKEIDFLLDPNARIIDISNQPMKLVGLKADDKVEVGYTRDKSKMTALFIPYLLKL